MTDDSPAGDDLVIDQDFIDKVKWDEDGSALVFLKLSVEVIEKLRDEHVITIIDNHCKADEVTYIELTDCPGITDATLAHISTKCTTPQLEGVVLVDWPVSCPVI